MTEALFQESKDEVANGIRMTLGVKHFFPGPLSAVCEGRKAAVRILGGTLSEGPVRKRDLKQVRSEHMNQALLNPNFVAFELLCRSNIPSMVAAKELTVIHSQGQCVYALDFGQCPFYPTAKFADNFKMLARCLAAFIVIESTIALNVKVSTTSKLLLLSICLNDKYDPEF